MFCLIQDLASRAADGTLRQELGEACSVVDGTGSFLLTAAWRAIGPRK
ncbi:MAG: hypothetical protein NTV04_00280 [Deltaproteobacteria bacterium]|nr:hypothetical protein [Deltaproteobacteria bacterium]